MNSKLIMSALVSTFAAHLFGSTIQPGTAECTQNTLAFYVSNFGVGGDSCSIGTLSFTGFNWSIFSTISGLDPITSTDLQVIPVVARNSFDIFPIASKPNLLNRVIEEGTFERYMLAYIVDPPPIIEGEGFTLDPPLGKVYATKFICEDTLFNQFQGNIGNRLNTVGRANYDENTFKCGIGAGTPATILKTDGDPNTVVTTSAAVEFDQPRETLDVRVVFDFEGTVTGFEGVQTTTDVIPEPGTNAMIASALVALGALSRYKRKK